MIQKIGKASIAIQTMKVSDYGRVRNIHTRRILKHIVKDIGFHYVHLYNDYGSKLFRVHDLVARAFIKNINSKPLIIHIDGDRANNCVSSARWAMHFEYNKTRRFFGFRKQMVLNI